MLHHLSQRLIVGHTRGVRRVLLRILVCRIGGDLGSNVVSYTLRDTITVGEQSPELIIEGLEDVAEPVEFRLRLVPVSINVKPAVAKLNLQPSLCFLERDAA